MKYFAFAFLAALVHSVPTENTAESLLVSVSPQSLAIDDKDFFDGVSVSFSLNEDPNQRVLILFDTADLFRLDICQLTFTRRDWQTPQTIKVYPEPTSQNVAQDIELSFKVCLLGGQDSSNGTCQVRDQSVKVARTSGQVGHCEVNLGLSVNTFGVLGNAIRGEGVRTLFKAQKTVIQMHSHPCDPLSPFCVDKVAIKHSDSFLMISFQDDATNPILVDYQRGLTDLTYVATPQQATDAVSSTKYDITLSDGIFVSITTTYYIQRSRGEMIISLDVSNLYNGLVSGACGALGAPATGDSQEVVESGSARDLFTCKNGCNFSDDYYLTPRSKCISTSSMPAGCAA